MSLRRPSCSILIVGPCLMAVSSPMSVGLLRFVSVNALAGPMMVRLFSSSLRMARAPRKAHSRFIVLLVCVWVIFFSLSARCVGCECSCERSRAWDLVLFPGWKSEDLRGRG